MYVFDLMLRLDRLAGEGKALSGWRIFLNYGDPRVKKVLNQSDT